MPDDLVRLWETASGHPLPALPTLGRGRMVTVALSDGLTRCPWCGTDPLYVAYHDEEWGVPVRDDRTLFEILILEGAQAGLSGHHPPQARGYRRLSRVSIPRRSRGTRPRWRRSSPIPGIIRNRPKVASAVGNARAWLQSFPGDGELSAFIWGFVDGRPNQNAVDEADLPAETPASEAISRELKRRGFRFVGPTICYAHMQATGWSTTTSWAASATPRSSPG